MDHRHKEVIAYIQQHLAQGYDKQQLHAHLQRHGWTAEQADEAFAAHADAYAPNPAPSELPAHGSQSPHAESIGQHQLSEQSTVTTEETPSAEQPRYSDELPLNPWKYRAFQGIGEAFSMVRHDWKTVLAVTAVTYLISLTAVAVVGFVLSTVMLLLGDKGIIWAVMGTLPLLFATVFAIDAYLTAGFSVMAANRKRGVANRPKNIVNQSFRLLPRVLKYSMLVMLRAYGPLMAMVLLTVGLTLFHNNAVFLALIPLSIGAAIYGLIVLLRYSLVTTVAALEPNHPRPFKRSKQLMLGGGQWYVIKLALVMIIPYAIISSLTSKYQWVSGVLGVIVGIIFNAGLAFFYIHKVSPQEG